jgi:hypothetical protein
MEEFERSVGGRSERRGSRSCVKKKNAAVEVEFEKDFSCFGYSALRAERRRVKRVKREEGK